MPVFLNPAKLFFNFIGILTVILLLCPVSNAYDGIESYYIRYDVKSSKNSITSENLLMMPAENEFRAENFSRQTVSGAINAASGESNDSIRKRIKEDALKTVLVQNGLKSISAKNLETVISYEGAIITPIHLAVNRVDNETKDYTYTATITFSSLSFPDKWESLKLKNKIKNILSNFFDLFK